MKFPIGQKIKDTLLKSGITQVHFASEIGMSRRNLERFFEREDITIHQLVKASEVLNYDFVSDYLGESNYPFNNKIAKEENTYEKFKKDEITVQLNIKGDITLVSKYFPEMLDIVKREANTRGLKIV